MVVGREFCRGNRALAGRPEAARSLLCIPAHQLRICTCESSVGILLWGTSRSESMGRHFRHQSWRDAYGSKLMDSRVPNESNLRGIRVGILGGGITGLTAAFYLLKRGAEVTVLERSPEAGGLA